MIGAAIAYIRGMAVQLLGGALVAALIGFSVQTWRIGRLKADVVQVTAERDAALKTASLSEALRGQEQTQDKASFTSADQRCDDRVNTARDAAATIKEIVHVPAFVQAPGYSGAVPDRALVPAAQLRRIVGQARDGEAAVLPAGGNSTPSH